MIKIILIVKIIINLSNTNAKKLMRHPLICEAETGNRERKSAVGTSRNE